MTEQPKAGTNPLTIPWPSDPQGALSKLKAGGLVAAKRVNGDKDRLDRLMATLRLIAEHAKARFDVDVEARNVAKVNAVSARARIADRQAKAAEAQAKEYEAHANRLRKQAGIKVEATAGSEARTVKYIDVSGAEKS